MSGSVRLVIGGARSGKSRHAEALAAAYCDVLYIATAPTYPDDPDWVARIAAHRARRPAHWRVQESAELAATLGAATAEVVLIDCLTLWVTRLMDEIGWEDSAADDHVDGAVAGLLAALSEFPGAAIIVSNEVGSGIVPAHAAGRRLADVLGRTNARVAAVADAVDLLVAGIPIPIKSQPTQAPIALPQP
ncbi:MAG: bifunctional adenosylcobinamide kinase/adenosylcobinamide-phosphate guanylyltransferase [Candidatus Nanopelagicales bacterium]